jgi:hypothetical protein
LDVGKRKKSLCTSFLNVIRVAAAARDGVMMMTPSTRKMMRREIILNGNFGNAHIA